MDGFEKIITLGISPCWDCTCEVDGIEWGEHKVICSASDVPAGKAFNINRALRQLGEKSIAGGLWGADDYARMLLAVEGLKDFVMINFTQASGATRRNTTVVDTANKRQIHLRQKSMLATKTSLGRLAGDIEKIADGKSVCVFAGALPGGDLACEVMKVIGTAKNTGAQIVVDSSGEALKQIVDAGGLSIIKPNLDELAELIGEEINDCLDSIIPAAKSLLDKAEIVVVSRGENGAVVVSGEGVLAGEYAGEKFDASNTVACGDFLLAGFLAGMKEKNDLAFALEKGIKAATGRAMGICDTVAWSKAQMDIEIDMKAI